MLLRDVIPNGIYGARLGGHVVAAMVLKKHRFNVEVRRYFESVRTWGLGEPISAADLFELPAGNPKLAAAIRARGLLRPDQRVAA